MSESVDFSGIRVDDVTVPEIVDAVERALDSGQKFTIGNFSPNSYNVARRDRHLQVCLNNMSVVCPDSVGTTLGAKILGRSLRCRVPGDVIAPHLCRMAISRGLSLYLLGGEPGVAEEAAAKLRNLYPNLNICGISDGYLTREKNERIVEQMNELKADIVFVGMGVPRQEKWIAENAHRVPATVILAVGGYFDHLLRRVDCYPAWVFRFRLVWLYRLLRDPKRLWRRYLIGNPAFMLSVLRYRLSLRSN
jgi:N-acetylglucosaminyldiphosphoundecaprenol N-acetyl-beta-D-mannosaminyltransferase